MIAKKDDGDGWGRSLGGAQPTDKRRNRSGIA